MLLCGNSSKYYQNRNLSARVSYRSTSQHAVTYSYTNICHSMTPSILVTVVKSVTIPSKSNNYYYLLKTHWGGSSSTDGRPAWRSSVETDWRWESNFNFWCSSSSLYGGAPVGWFLGREFFDGRRKAHRL